MISYFSASTCRVMNLQDPTTKMSKSATTSRGRIDLNDSPTKIREKVKKAVTDSVLDISYEPKERPGVANLINLYSTMKGVSPQQIVRDYEGKVPFTKYLKNDLADELISELEQFHREFKRLEREKSYVMNVLETGWTRASAIAKININEVKKLLGLD